MSKYLIHISDIHFQENIEENQDLVLNAFFKDLREQIKSYNSSDVYFIISGDIVMSGDDKKAFDAAYSYFDKQLGHLRISKENRICVPGNHDLSRKCVDQNIEHKTLVNSNLSEKDFNDYVAQSPFPELLTKKFENFFFST